MRSKPCSRAACRLMPITVMPKALQIGARYSAIRPTPRMPTVLPYEQLRRPALPFAFVLRAGGARQVARQRQHIGDGRFRHRRAVDAADIGDQDLFAERGQVDDVVDAGAERLDPFQLGRVAHHVVGHRRGKAQQDVGVGDIGADIVMMADHIDGQLRKPLQQHGLVTGPHRFLDFGEDQHFRHSGSGAGITAIGGKTKLPAKFSSPFQSRCPHAGLIAGPIPGE